MREVVGVLIVAVATLISAAGQPTDDRPVVEVFSQLGPCEPCQRFEKWLKENGSKSAYRFEVKRVHPNEMPDWISEMGGTPCFRFRTADGSNVAFSGWNGEEYLDKHYKRLNQKSEKLEPIPMTTPLPRPKPSAVDAATISRFVGKKGTFALTPESPIKATLDDGTTLSYTKLVGTYEERDGQLVIDITEPAPKFRITRWGFGVTGAINGAEYPGGKPGSIGVNTTYGRFNIVMEKQ